MASLVLKATRAAIFFLRPHTISFPLTLHISCLHTGFTHDDGVSMPPNNKWPDFRLASTLWSLVGSQASGSDKPATSEGTSSQAENHQPEQHPELHPIDERDDHQNGSHNTADAMMDPDGRPIGGLEAFDNFEHDAQVEDAPDNEADFGTLEMFDSNATQAPYTSQLPSSAFGQDSKAPEAVMENAVPSSHSKKSKRDKKDRKKKGASQESASPQPSAEEGSRKHKKMKKRQSVPVEIPDSLPTGNASDALQEQLAYAEAASNTHSNDETSVPSTQPKRKRKPSDAADSKQRKKRRPDDGEVEAASQDVVQGTPDDESPEAQNSPSAARLQRRSQSRDARSRENSVLPNNGEMDLDSQLNATVNQGDSGDRDLGTDSIDVNGSAGAAGTEAERDVENLAREAWNEHVNGGQGQNDGDDVYDVPGSPVEAPNPPSSNTKRPRQSRPRKAKPTFFEKPPSPEEEYADLPSPSAMTPKPRRAKTASKKRKTKTEPPSYSMHEADDYDAEGFQGRRNRMAGYTQGRFSEEELSRIAMAVERFRSERDMPQHQVNDMIHAPGGTTAGDEHAALWAHVFETCPDRHRQKIINITRKKFHNFVARGTWTPEQETELRDLIEVHGTKWSKIAAIINRHPEDLRDRYRNYIVCGDAQRKDSWDEREESNLTQYVMEAMGAIDELRRIQPSRELLKKPYEELIDWQNISERMERTRSRLQCITKWKAMNIKTHGKDKLVSHEPNAQISFNLEKARRQIADMPEEERYRLVLAIHGSSVSSESKIPWQKLVDKQYRTRWHRSTQMLLWRRLQQTIPGWDEKTVRDCAQYLVDQYNQMGELPEIRDENYNDALEMEFIGTIPTTIMANGGTNNISEEYVGNSDVEGEDQVVDDLKMEIENGGVPDENIQPDLPVEPMEIIEHMEAIQPDLPVEPMEQMQLTEPIEPVEPVELVEPVEFVEPAPPKATRSAKKSAPGKSRAPRRSTPARRASSRRTAAPSQDPIQDDDGFLVPPSGTAEDNSDIDDARFRKRKTPSKFRSPAAAEVEAKGDDSDSVMDDMEDLPARVPA